MLRSRGKGIRRTVQGARVYILNSMIRKGFPGSKGVKVKEPVEDPDPLPCFLYFFSSSLLEDVKLRDGEGCMGGERGLVRGCFVNVICTML